MCLPWPRASLLLFIVSELNSRHSVALQEHEDTGNASCIAGDWSSPTTRLSSLSPQESAAAWYKERNT